MALLASTTASSAMQGCPLVLLTGHAMAPPAASCQHPAESDGVHGGGGGGWRVRPKTGPKFLDPRAPSWPRPRPRPRTGACAGGARSTSAKVVRRASLLLELRYGHAMGPSVLGGPRRWMSGTRWHCFTASPVKLEIGTISRFAIRNIPILGIWYQKMRELVFSSASLAKLRAST